MDNPLVRSRGLSAYTTEELVNRAHELWMHNHLLVNSPAYLSAYLSGNITPDPFEGYDAGPWYDYDAIDNFLKGRV